MGELEEKLQQILQDPEQMRSISAMAQKLMGGAAQHSEPSAAADALSSLLESSGGTALGALLGGSKSKSLAALEALKPVLSEKRRAKLERAISLASLARLAQGTLKAKEGGGDAV